MSVAAATGLGPDFATTAEVPVGKDLLELVSTAMYVDPLTVFREYAQNAADAIDQARSEGSLDPKEPGILEITLDPARRSVRIRDNGCGIPSGDMPARIRALGGSAKRGTGARGFRGVGRLAGLAYAQKLIFRSRSHADEPVTEIAWDCRLLRSGLKDAAPLGLAEFVERITTVELVDGEWPERFFEVEMAGVVRLRDDRLLRAETVAEYLAQVAPVAFAPEFALAREIEALLEPHREHPPLRITVNDGPPLVRPHRDQTPAGQRAPLPLRVLETFVIPGIDGEVAAVGWIAHHDYEGAIPVAALVKGLRARAGDIQVGDHGLLDEIFPETRFNSWTVGEVHVLDPRIVPNGRRDDFEQNVHYANLLNHLAPIGRDIARRCRTNSANRQRERAFQSLALAVDSQLEVLQQGALGAEAATEMASKVARCLERLEQSAREWSDRPAGEEMLQRVVRQREALATAVAESRPSSPLEKLRGEFREGFQAAIDLVYECSANRVAAKSLVDRILDRLG